MVCHNKLVDAVKPGDRVTVTGIYKVSMTMAIGLSCVSIAYCKMLGQAMSSERSEWFENP